MDPLRRADEALCLAKNDGRDCLRLADAPVMPQAPALAAPAPMP